MLGTQRGREKGGGERTAAYPTASTEGRMLVGCGARGLGRWEMGEGGRTDTCDEKGYEEPCSCAD